MNRKITKSGSISRRRLLTTVSAGAALAVSPFRINLLQAQETPIKIGFPVPLTGPYGTEAQDQVRAGQLAVTQFNDAGGLRAQAGGQRAETNQIEPNLTARDGHWLARVPYFAPRSSLVGRSRARIRKIGAMRLTTVPAAFLQRDPSGS